MSAELPGPAQYQQEQDERAAVRKRDAEVKRLYQSTAGYPWHSPSKWNVNSLAAKFDLPSEDIRKILCLR